VKKNLVKSFNESYSEQKCSLSQRQGIITCIPKEGKSKYSLKNWRPIILLNVDLKICSAAISNRLKPVLVDLISQTQKVFLRGRYIGECTRLIFDLIEKMEEEDIPGLLVLLDFEKALDTVQWSFLYKTLQFFGFGESFCSWIKTFYNDISSCIINNGHRSDYFKLGRGVRQ
jgi:hypothetical protein